MLLNIKEIQLIMTVGLTLLFPINSNAQNNYSIEFIGGDDYINIGRPINLASTSDSGSFSVWFKSSQISADPGYFISNDTQPTNPEFNFGLIDGKVIVNGGPGSTDGPTVISPVVYSDGNWHHAVAIKESNCVTLYVDNIFIGQDCSAGGIMDTGDDYFIGDNRVEGLADYIGLLDEFRIYDKVLNSTEVSDLFNCGGNEIPNLVAHYKFEEGSGTVIIDSAGSYNGVMYNMDINNSWNTDVYCNPLNTPEFTINSLKIYPTLTSGIISIETETPIAEINIYNLSGQLVLTNTNQNIINISNLNAGIYFICVMDVNQILTIKKVVKK